MTTYLATKRETLEDSTWEKTFAFCSDQCRMDQGYEFYYRTGIRTDAARDDNRYEFDETCANCGVEIPASGRFFGYVTGFIDLDSTEMNVVRVAATDRRTK